MENPEINHVIAARPYTYGWLWFQRLVLCVFLLLGIILLLVTVCIIVYGAVEYLLIQEVAHDLAKKIGHREEILDFLIDYFEPIKYLAIACSFFLSLSFFIIARYCQKTLNRNRYILLLEEELKRRQ